MAGQIEFGDLDAFREELRGSTFDQINGALNEFAGQVHGRLPKLGAVATATIVGANLGLSAASAAPHESSPVRTIEAAEPPGATLWGLGQAYAEQAGISASKARTIIWKLNGNSDPLMHGRDLKLPLAAGTTIHSLKPGETLSGITARLAGPNRIKFRADLAVVEQASGVTSEGMAENLPVGFKAIIPAGLTVPAKKPGVVFDNGGAVYKPDQGQPPKIITKPVPAVTEPKPHTEIKTVPKPAAHQISVPQTAPAETTPATPVTPPAPPITPVTAPTPAQPATPKVREAAVPVVVRTHAQPTTETPLKPGLTAAQILKWECSPDSTHALIGGNRELKAIHYFMTCNNDSLAAATGIVGNMEHEDVGLDPLRIENGVGDSRNPSAAGQAGWGIAQWTPGAKASLAAQEVGIKNIYKLRDQLALVAYETNHTSPTGAQDINAQLKAETDPSAAATIFEQDFEAPLGGGNLPNRQALAQQAVQEYQSLHPHGYTPIPAKPHHHKKPHHHAHHEAKQPAAAHQGVNGIIATEIEKLTHVSYSLSMPAGHYGILRWISDNPHFEASSNPDQDIDCGTAADTAVTLSTGGRYLRDNNTTTMRSDPNYKPIPFSEVGPGDLIQPDPNHVEVVTGVKGDMIYTFGAHTSLVPQPDQVSPAAYDYQPGDGYLFLRYVGPGYPLGNTAEAPTPALTAALNGTLAPAPVAPPKPAAPAPKPETPSQAISTVHHRLHHHHKHSTTAPVNAPEVRHHPPKLIHPLRHHLVHLPHNRHRRIF